MTLEERLAALEIRCAQHDAFLQKYFQVVTVDDPDYPEPQSGLMQLGRQGANTTFWMANRVRDGALASFGNAACWCGVYVENEGPQVNADRPSVALYAAALTSGPRPNIGLQAIAGGAPDKNGISQNYAGYFDGGGGRALSIQREGFQLFGVWDRVLIGPAGGPYKQLWP